MAAVHGNGSTAWTHRLIWPGAATKYLQRDVRVRRHDHMVEALRRQSFDGHLDPTARQATDAGDAR